MIFDLNPAAPEMLLNDEISFEEMPVTGGCWSWRRTLGGTIDFALGGPVGAYIEYQLTGSFSSNASDEEIEVITSPSPEECMNLPPVNIITN